MMSIQDLTISSLLPASVILHMLISPFTKVEESFNIQATHDILLSGIPLNRLDSNFTKNYDHVSFPGAVPRTFVGALFLAGATSPWLSWVTTSQAQLLVRGALGLFNSFALLRFQSAVSESFGSATGRWYLLLQATQFHVIYYSSRTLPNMFAFGITTLSLRSLLIASSGIRPNSQVMKHFRICLYLITIAGVIFRSELAILVTSISLYLLVVHRVSIYDVILPAGSYGLLTGLLFTVPIDSFFWQTFPIWPEWVGFYYNTVLGQSSEWGTLPWYYYFANAVPKLLLNPFTSLILVPTGLITPANRTQTMTLAAPSFAFIAVYSLLPHKEWRFIIYIIPGLTAIAANGASWIWNRRNKSVLYQIFSLGLLASVPLSFALSVMLLYVSALNYPGGEALTQLHSIIPSGETLVRVHLDNLSCQTGVTRFLQIHDAHKQTLDPQASDIENPRVRWIYDKTEDQTKLLDPEFWQQFDYVLAERPEKVIGGWDILYEQYAFAGMYTGKGNHSLIASTHGPGLAESNGAYGKVIGSLKSIEDALKGHVTRGWWIGIKMEPKIRILKRQPT